jgi:aspartate ammonia-lyase
VAEIVLARGLLTKEQLNEILRPEVLTQPRWIEKGNRQEIDEF